MKKTSDQKAQEARASQIMKEVEAVVSGKGGSSAPPSPREFIHQQMAKQAAERAAAQSKATRQRKPKTK